jgi:hypothetical protein
MPFLGCGDQLKTFSFGSTRTGSSRGGSALRLSFCTQIPWKILVQAWNVLTYPVILNALSFLSLRDPELTLFDDEPPIYNRSDSIFTTANFKNLKNFMEQGALNIWWRRNEGPSSN